MKIEKPNQEVWKKIPGFGFYDASTYGRIRSWCPRGPNKERSKKPRVLKPLVHGGAERTKLKSDNGMITSVEVARILCITFFGPPPSIKSVATHKNGDSSDNHIDNLYWGSFSDVLRTPHSLLIQSLSKRTWPVEVANKVRRLYRKGVKVIDIAATIEGMTPGNVTNIACGGYPDSTELPCEPRTTHHLLGKPGYSNSTFGRYDDAVALRVIQRVAMGQTVKQAANDEGVAYCTALRWTSGKARAYLGEEFRDVLERKCLGCGVVITHGKRCPICAEPHNKERRRLDSRRRYRLLKRKQRGYVNV